MEKGWGWRSNGLLASVYLFLKEGDSELAGKLNFSFQKAEEMFVCICVHACMCVSVCVLGDAL